MLAVLWHLMGFSLTGFLFQSHLSLDWFPTVNLKEYANHSSLIVIIILIAVDMTVFMVQSSWHCLCKSSPGSSLLSNQQWQPVIV